MWWRYERKPRVAEQRALNEKAGRELSKKGGRALTPVVIQGSKIATSVWGKAWCKNLEAYRDYEYRLPRGRSYVRHGAVIHLDVQQGAIKALVSGSQVYEVEVRIHALAPDRWGRLKTRSAGQVGSLIELLEGRLSEGVMRIMTDPAEGLFPKPAEIKMDCSCPDSATMCKHVAAVLYGVGARLDEAPQLLFLLRHVDHTELITGAVDLGKGSSSGRKTLSNDELGDVFGIEMAEEAPAPARKTAAPARKSSAPKAAGSPASGGKRPSPRTVPPKAATGTAAPVEKTVAAARKTPRKTAARKRAVR